MGRVYRFIGNAVGVSIGLFALLIPLDLLLRKVGAGNLPGLQEIIEYALFAGVFLAAPWVLRLGAHVRVDLVIGGLTEEMQTKADRVIDLAGLLICGVLTWYGLRNLASAWSSGSQQMKYFNVSEWWLLAILVVSLGLLVLEFAFRIMRGGDAPEAGEEAEGGV